MKKKSLTMLLTSLLAVSLTGVGFASWIIVQGDEKAQEGSVSVETVETKKLTVTASWDEGNDIEGNKDNVFSFGPTSSSNQTGWLRNSTMDEERLTLKLNVEVDNWENYGTGVTITAAAKANKDKFADAVTAGYITNITVGEYTAAESFSVDISIDWGAKFHNENPYTYYNNITATEDVVKEAKENLEALYTALKDVTFEVTIKSF